MTDLGYRTHKRSKNLDLAAVETLEANRLGRALSVEDRVVLDRKTELESRVVTKTPVPRSGVIG